MAEDQGVNGDIWNEQATTLLTKFNWETLGDSNIDLPNEDNTQSGVDRLFTFVDSLKAPLTEGVIVEAKRYNTDSLSLSALQTWITVLDRKLNKLKSSSELQEKFPAFESMPLRIGIIMIWFHNVNDYHSFRSTFNTYMGNVKLHRKNQASNKIYVLENDAILRLAAMHISIKELNASIGDRFQFYYPSVDLHPAKRSKTLNVNYMVSKFILGDYVGNDNVENKVVFYFGGLGLEDFQRLKHALISYSYIDDDKPLTIYTHARDDEQFRKIRVEVVKLFKDNLTLKEMELLVNLPTFMRQ